jgi:hypothetical protein
MVNFDFMERYRTTFPRYTRFGAKLSPLFGLAKYFQIQNHI